MNREEPVYIVDFTRAEIQKLLAYLEAVARDLGSPPELTSILPRNFSFDSSRVPVLVQPSVEPEKKARNWEHVRGNIYKPDFPRAIVLGDFGSGKSWLMRYEGRNLARSEIERLRRGDVGTAGVLIPLYVPMARLSEKLEKPEKKNNDSSFLSGLREAVKDQHIPFVDDLWTVIERKIECGQTLILLDGWDEVREGQERLKDELETFARRHPQCRFYLTSRPSDYRPLNVPEIPVFTLASLEANQWKAFIHKFPADNRKRYDPVKLIDQLSTFEMQPLAANLRLLSIVCFLVDQGVDLPATPDEFYKQGVDKLLDREQTKVVYPVGEGELPLIRKRRILERTAHTLQGVREPFNEGTVVDALTKGVETEGLGSPADVANTLLIDLIRNSGILQGNYEQGYSFLHTEFQKYLAKAARNRKRQRLSDLAKIILEIVGVVSILVILVYYLWCHISPFSVPPPPAAFQEKLWRLDWIAYEPTSYDPVNKQYPKEEDIEEDLRILHDFGFRGIITFGSGKSLAQIPRLAKEVGFLGVIMGIQEPNKESIAAAIKEADYVDGYSVGHNNEQVPMGVLLKAMKDLRCKTGKPVTTTFYMIDYDDYIVKAVNWPFPDIGVGWRWGRSDDKKEFQDIKQKIVEAEKVARAHNKPVLLKVISFPSGGHEKYTPAMQSEFYEGILKYFKTDPGYPKYKVGLSYFLAFDSPWKQGSPEEPYLGLFDQKRKPKPAACQFVEATKASKVYRPGFEAAQWVEEYCKEINELPRRSQ